MKTELMILQDSNVPSCSPMTANFHPNDNIEQHESRMMNILRSYEEQYNQNIFQFENESQLLNTSQKAQTDQLNTVSSNISDSLPNGNSYVLNEDISNNELKSHIQVNKPQQNLLPNLNNFSNRDPRVNSTFVRKPAKHMSDDETSIIKEKSMSDLMCENEDSFSSRQIGQSRSDIYFLQYSIHNHQPLANPILEKFKSNQDQISNICKPQLHNNLSNENDKKTEIPPINNENDIKSDYSDGENGIPLGMTLDSQISTDLSLLNLNESKSTTENKHTKHKNNRISLTESRLHGKNNSGEFVGRNPSLMTIVEDDDDAEEEFEYEEDYEEDAEENNKDIKEDEKDRNINIQAKILGIQQQNKVNEKQTTRCINTSFSFTPKSFTQSSGSQHNISTGITRHIQTSNSTNSLALCHYIKSYAGLNSKIINLNPTDDDNDYDYDYDENPNSPISLKEASDINKYSHQSGLNGSRTIEDLIEEQKRTAIASSSSAIAALAANREIDENDNFNNNRRTFKKRSNISLSELVPKERACFTVEDMMRLQNIHFSSNKGKTTTSNSGDIITKTNKPKYSEEDMIKDQNISILNNNGAIYSNQHEKNNNNAQSRSIETIANSPSQSVSNAEEHLANSVSDKIIATNFSEGTNDNSSLKYDTNEKPKNINFSIPYLKPEPPKLTS